MAPADRAVSVVFGGGAGDEVLVVRRDRGGRRYCVLPGGGVEPGEEPSTAAVRELREETGLTGRVDQHLPGWLPFTGLETEDLQLAEIPSLVREAWPRSTLGPS